MAADLLLGAPADAADTEEFVVVAGVFLGAPADAVDAGDATECVDFAPGPEDARFVDFAPDALAYA